MSKAKGNRTKRKCIKYYAGKGWRVQDVENNYKFAIRKDLFDLFDLIAIKGRRVMFIQVKTNKPATQKDYKDWAEKHGSENLLTIVWTWYDREGPRIQQYMPDRTIKETDER